MAKKLRHIGIVVDGNRRWAKKRGLTPIEGHRAGYKTLKKLLRENKDLDVDVISVYAFSTENWKRSKTEVDGLMKLFGWLLRSEVNEAIDEGLRIVFLGSKDKLSTSIIKLMKETEQRSAHNKRTLAVCLNYGGQREIIEAARKAVAAGEVNQKTIDAHIYHPEIPPLDLVIRTGGEQRLSNFMLWRIAYAELMFTDTLWPDFSSNEFRSLIDAYHEKERRFGA